MSVRPEDAGVPGAAGDHHVPTGDVPVPAPQETQAGAWLGQTPHL